MQRNHHSPHVLPSRDCCSWAPPWAAVETHTRTHTPVRGTVHTEASSLIKHHRLQQPPPQVGYFLRTRNLLSNPQHVYLSAPPPNTPASSQLLTHTLKTVRPARSAPSACSPSVSQRMSRSLLQLLPSALFLVPCLRAYGTTVTLRLGHRGGPRALPAHRLSSVFTHSFQRGPERQEAQCAPRCVPLTG